MKKLLLVLALIFILVLPVFGQTGTYTTNEYFYLPLYGSYGTTEFDEYEKYMEIADNQIKANKDAFDDFEVSDITDVDLTDIANLKILKYNSTTEKWECEDDGGAGFVTTSGSPVANDIARFTDANTVEGRSYSELKADLSLEIGTDVQAQDAGLESISGLTTAANKSIYTTALDTYATYDLTAFGRTILDDADASAVRTTLGLVIGTNVQAYDDALTSISGLTYVSPSFIKLTGNDAYEVRTLTETKTDLDIDDLENVTNYMDSPGIVAGGEITEGSTGTFTVAAITAAYLRASASATAALMPVTLAIQSNQVISAADTTYYVIFTYGTPCTITTSVDAPNGYNAISLGKVMKDTSNNVHYVSGGFRLGDGVAKLWKRAKALRDIELMSGNTIAYSGTNNFTMTEGKVYAGGNLITQAVYNSASTTFTTVYTGFVEGNSLTGIDIAIVDGGEGNDSVTRTAADFVTNGYVVGDELTIAGSAADDGTYTLLAVAAGTLEVAAGSFTGEAAGESITLTVAKYKIDFEHYDNAGTLTAIGNNKYGCHWVYRHVDDGDVWVVYGRGSYSLADAETALEPTRPDHLTDFGCLIGCIIAPQAGSSFTAVQMVTDRFFVGTNTSNHNYLGGLQGGTTTEYYHLTFAQHTIATQAADTTNSGYLLTADWDTFNNKAGSGANSDITQLMGLTTALGAAYGGTGVLNNVANTLTFTGNYSLGLTLSANTALTSPTTGTLATLAGTETFTNKTLTSPKLNEDVAVTTTATKLNYLTSTTGTTGTASSNVVFSTSPSLVTPALGVATATSISTPSIISAANADIVIQPNGTGNTRIYAPTDVVTTVTAAHTMTIAEAGTVLVSCAATPYTITLPTAVGHSGLRYHFIKTDANYFLITLDGDGTETLNYENSTSTPNTTYGRLNTLCAEVTIVSDNSNWQVINEAMGQVPKCWTSLSANQENITNTTFTLVAYDTESYDIGSNFNTTTHEFTVPISGTYQINALIRYLNVVTDKIWYLSIKRQSTYIYQGIAHSSSTSDLTRDTGIIASLTKDDVIGVYAYHNAGVNTPDLQGAATCFNLVITLLSKD